MRLLALSATVALFAAAALCAGGARADGDPASDVLVSINAYLPATPPSKTATAGLEKQIAAVYAAGDRIKVAVIAARYDLGAIPSLFNKPTTYARFLGEELSTIYIGPLLIVMPGGYGVYDGGRSTAAETSVLATLTKPASRRPDDLTAAATAAVAALLKNGALRSPDILAPFIEIVRAAAAGNVLTLKYFLYDDSGRAASTLELVNGNTTLLTKQVPTAPTNVNYPVTKTIVVPPGVSLAGTHACVEATDPSGNKTRSCHAVAVKR